MNTRLNFHPERTLQDHPFQKGQFLACVCCSNDPRRVTRTHVIGVPVTEFYKRHTLRLPSLWAIHVIYHTNYRVLVSAKLIFICIHPADWVLRQSPHRKQRIRVQAGLVLCEHPHSISKVAEMRKERRVLLLKNKRQAGSSVPRRVGIC